ncbi:MAG: hypothetical protein IT204_01090 [Fimbriimonadaceae bacterium]|nr:hypothetical protein [Fimbriimonadaceae bacterium]
MRHLIWGLFLLTAGAGQNLCPDPSIEATQPRNQFGVPYAKWGGWLFEGACEFRNGRLARTGQSCAELVGGQPGKLRVYTPALELPAGRYRFRVWLRGLDVGVHPWGLSEDLNFADEQYHPLKLSGSFDWTSVELVKDLPGGKPVFGRIGLLAPGRLWVDDATVERVPEATPLTAQPVVGTLLPLIAPRLDPVTAVRCGDCRYLTPPAAPCWACGAPVAATTAALTGPPSRLLASFEDGQVAPFSPGAAAVVAEHASDGRRALRLDRSYLSWEGPQDWSGYDYLVVDAYNPDAAPQQLYLEVRDAGTTGYWTRVNYTTVLPPGASKVMLPTEIYVGEKSRPGRPLDKARVTRLVFSVGDDGPSVYLDAVRLERDALVPPAVPGLRAFSFGPTDTPPWRDFLPVSAGTQYSPGRGYGLRGARVWRAYDVLQPDPLYQRFLCLEAGDFVVDLPNGEYEVFLNLDNPSGFWGEYQVYRQRVVRANGVEVVRDTMDREGFLAKYYRFAETEDLPSENTFDKYQRAYFQEQRFRARVTDGQLRLTFEGANWANSVSALVVWPTAQAADGEAWLEQLVARRRFAFDNYFKRILPSDRRDAQGEIPAFEPTAAEREAGLVAFVRDWMDVPPYHGLPRREEVGQPIRVAASAGSSEPVVCSLHALRELGEATLSVGELVGPNGVRLPSSVLQTGIVVHRLSRVTMEGTVYTIRPRLILPRTTATLRAGSTTTCWLTLQVPAEVTPGLYRGSLTVSLAAGGRLQVPLEVRLFARPLDEVDVPVGPWGCSIDLPWYSEDLGNYDEQTYLGCLRLLRSCGVTSFSGIPTVRLRGWTGGRPNLDFTLADRQMALAREAGFKHLVVNYNGGLQGFNNYLQDTAAMRSAGFGDYQDFLRAYLTPLQEHARAAGWLPVAYNLCDEPIGDAIPPHTANAAAWRAAAPADLLTTGATSLTGAAAADPHLALAQSVKIANLNTHDPAAIQAIRAGGGQWAFYNGGNRFTLGLYMLKAVREAGMAFRLSWHFNATAGDPYYALDSREDDYAWVVSNARGELLPTLELRQQVQAGLTDYRAAATLERLLRERPTHPAAPAARQLLTAKLAGFQLGQRNHGALWPSTEANQYRRQVLEALEALGR